MYSILGNGSRFFSYIAVISADKYLKDVRGFGSSQSQKTDDGKWLYKLFQTA